MDYIAGGRAMSISSKKPLFSEPKVLVTGVEGAGKTLFAVQQAHLLSMQEGAQVYQVNIRGADPGHLPKLPFDLREMSKEVDLETGDLLPRWAVDLPPGTVVIVDEAHKVYPQRGPGKPPKDIEMLGEGRQKGIRFIYLSQSPDSIDQFLRDRIHRHFQLERPGNFERATIFEFDHYVYKPRTAWLERKDAQVHFWPFPKEYFGWYTSAKVHNFKRRIPWKIVAALLFVPVAIFIGYTVISQIGGITQGVMPGESAAGGGASEVATVKSSDPVEYLAQFQPVSPAMPWSAPAFQGRKAVSRPEIYCMYSASGQLADGSHAGASCTCLSEQGTTIVVDNLLCREMAKTGLYNPFREPRDEERERSEPGRKLGKPNDEASSVATADAEGLTEFGEVPGYGGIGVGASPR